MKKAVLSPWGIGQAVEPLQAYRLCPTLKDNGYVRQGLLFMRSESFSLSNSELIGSNTYSPLTYKTDRGNFLQWYVFIFEANGLLL